MRATKKVSIKISISLKIPRYLVKTAPCFTTSGQINHVTLLRRDAYKFSKSEIVAMNPTMVVHTL